MSFQTLALISLVALAGPLLALPRGWHVPVVLGELAAGIILGPTGSGTLHASNATFTFLADIGFALIMFVAGSHVPVRDPRLRPALRVGVLRALAVGVIAAGLGVLLSHALTAGHGHAALYAVLMASSSAALVLPIVDSLQLGGDPVLQMLPQVALADTACIVALPLAIDPTHALRAALGALAVIAAAGVVYVVLRYLERSGLRHKAHVISEQRKFALELRVSLIILCALAALAVKTHVSIMLAGFALGLGVAAIGEPRRLARQLFALSDGFLGPLFFVWVGASLDLRELGRHPSAIWLGVALGAGALACHVAMRVSGQPVSIGTLASGQLGVPVAAVTVGTQLHVLRPGEPSALVLGALITILAASIFAGLAKRNATGAVPTSSSAAPSSSAAASGGPAQPPVPPAPPAGTAPPSGMPRR